MTSSGEPLDVVFFGSYDAARHPRVAVLRDGIADRGHRVTELNSPLGMSTADKVHAAASLSGSISLGRRVLRSWFDLYRMARSHRDPDLVVVGYLGHFDVHLARWLWPSTPIALDHLVGLADTANDRGVASGLKYRLLDRLDRAALRKADTVIVDTEEQLAPLPPEVVDRAVVVPVGATANWFVQPPAPPPPPLRVCFVGLYAPLHGAPVIGRAMALLADDDRFEFTMVGTGQDLEKTRAAAGDARVTWIDWVASDDLAGLVGSQHVCLGIFGTSDKAQRVVPTKVYQGLAAGNVVITSDTAPQRRALGDAALYVPPGDAAALAARLREVVEDLEAADLDGRSRAERFRPAAVVGPLLDGLRRLDGTPAPGAQPPRQDLSKGPALPPNAWLRFDLVRHALAVDPGSKVLEIGPGRGAVAARMVAAGQDYTGIEMSPEARATTGDLLAMVPGGRHRLLAGIEELDPADRFDLAYAFEVLEHIEDDLGALTQWVDRLVPGGTLVLSVPGFSSRFSTHDAEVGHLRRYDPADLRHLAARAGLVDIQVRAYGFPLGYLLEGARNLMSGRIQRRHAVDDESAGERTQRSGSWYQPPSSANRLIQLGTWPFRVLQRPFPTLGTGLVLIARAPVRR